MNGLRNIAYTAKVTVKGGREGAAKSDDKRLDILLSAPKGLGGDNGQGTNPEQLFAAGYAACFMGALEFVADKENYRLSKDSYIEAQVSIGAIDGGFGLAVTLAVSLDTMSKYKAQIMVDKAHKVCPYSNATRGNIDVTLTVI